MGSAKGDSWLSCAGGWLGSAGGTTEPPRSQSPIGQGCGHAVGDDAAAQSLDDHWCLRCVQLTTLGETLCPSCKTNLIVPFKSSFHIPPYLALRHFASAWRHARREDVACSRYGSGQRDTHRARSPGGSGSVGVRLGQRRSFGRRQFGRRRRQLRRWLRRRLARFSRVWQWRVGQRRVATMARGRRRCVAAAGRAAFGLSGGVHRAAQAVTSLGFGGGFRA